ncbi:site-specific integrase [Streptomyces avermitilis]|uniref:site-specific integrase n=1 Tax=Streptomyces avermitilis TaxID=33903 RepID=UPI0033EDDC55
MPTASGVPRPHARRVRAAPGPDPPGSSRCRIKGVSHAGSSRTPLRPASRTRTIWQYWHVPALSGLLPPSPAPPGSGCPQLHRPAATGSAAKASHLHSNHCASRRTHDLRHTCASLLHEQGADARMIMEVLGHSSIRVTMDIYTFVRLDSQRSAFDRVGDALRGDDNRTNNDDGAAGVLVAV